MISELKSTVGSRKTKHCACPRFISVVCGKSKSVKRWLVKEGPSNFSFFSIQLLDPPIKRNNFFQKYCQSPYLTLDLMETLDLFFRRACCHWNASYRKNKENKSCWRTLDLEIRFCSFFVHDSSTELARKSPKFPSDPKLEAFTVR